MLLCSLILIFLCAFGLPLLPGLLEILRPVDAGALIVDRRYARTPAFFADSYRRKIAQNSFLRRHGEQARWENDFVIPAGTQERDIVVATGQVRVNDGARLIDIVAEGDVHVGNDVQARVLSSGKSLRIGDRSRIDRWAHAEGDLVVGQAVKAGSALTALGTLSLHDNVRFQRAFGMPIRVISSVKTFPPRSAPRNARIVADNTTVKGDIVCNGDLVIGSRCTVRGSIKAHGTVMVGADTRIDGNIVSRKDIVIGPRTKIFGHVFAEEKVSIDAQTTVGTQEAHKSVYGRARVELADGATVWGAIVNEPAAATAERINISAIFVAGVIAAATFFAAITLARADQPAPAITLTQSDATFSPSTYGNEDITTLATRVPLGSNQPGISFAQGTGSVLSPWTSSHEFVVDDYAQFSKSAFVYASVSSGTGSIFPSSGAYAEIDATVARGWSAAAGAGTYSYLNGVNETYLSVGPTYYFHDGTVSLLARPQWFAGSGSAMAVELAAQYGRRGDWIASMRLENGLDPTIIGQAPFVPEPAEHGSVALLQWQRWFSPLGGIIVGAETDTESNRTNSTSIYTRQALTAGVFFSPSH